jgi:LysM repeat protein
MQATFETCIQESHCNNLKCGDQDSLGAFQQRPSMGWGTPAQITDPTYAANKFLEQAIPLAAKNPGYTPDQIAQGVQHAELGNLYAQRFDWANQLIQQAEARTKVKFAGAGDGSTPAPKPAPAPKGCAKKVTAKAGDSCWSISQAHGVSNSAFMSANPSINSGCTNLKVGTQYCL